MKLEHWLVPGISLLTVCVLAGGPVLAASDGGRVIAIDVLLEPDATMVAKAEAANARLRENYAQGYTLGPDHVAHITLVHRYVRAKDLPAIEAALNRALAKQHPTAWKLTATRFTHAIWSGLAITTIAIDRTPELDQLEGDVVKAVEPFAITGGTTAAFSTTRELPKIDSEIVSYVEKFTSNSSGKRYAPHVTIGVAHEDFIKKLEAEPFATFKFCPAGVAIYQLGNFGTAQKKLWQWKPQPSTKR